MRQNHFSCYGAGNIFVKGIIRDDNRPYIHIDGGAVDQFNVDVYKIFNDYDTNDFSLKVGSPAIGNGDNLGLKDFLGNLISGKSDIGAIPFGYSFNQTSGLKTFLEGCYFDDGVMAQNLDDQKVIPLSQPYNNSPWNYSGNESVTSIPPNIVDWVLVELRSNKLTSSRVAIKAAFINSVRKDS